MTNQSSEFKSSLFRIETLGCRVNQYESDALTAELLARGMKQAAEGEQADLQILNTCTVTAEAGRKVRQLLRRMRSEAPEALLVAWGCHAELGAEGLDCDLVLGNRAKAEAADYMLAVLADEQADEQKKRVFRQNETVHLQALQGVAQEVDYLEFPEAPRPQESRAYVKVQDGCDNHCTYCAIRLVRGPSRSRSLASVVREVETLVAAGYCEIQLSGIHLSAYGKDLKPAIDLGDLVLALDSIEGLERLRLGSLEPEIIRDEVLKKLAEAGTLAPHFHLALQSGSATILKRMGRNYTTAEYAAAVERLRHFLPESELATDLMVGFPGETEEEHRESMAFVEAVGFSNLHIFRYSPRPGTASVRLPNPVPGAVKKRRAGEAEALREVLQQRALERQLGRVERIMIEGDNPVHGYTGTYLLCELIDQKGRETAPIGGMQTVKVTKVEGDRLQGVTLW